MLTPNSMAALSARRLPDSIAAAKHWLLPADAIEAPHYQYLRSVTSLYDACIRYKISENMNGLINHSVYWEQRILETNDVQTKSG